MATQTESIAAAIVALLTAAPQTPAAGRVRTDTADPYSFEDTPAIVVDIGGETPDTQNVVSGGYIYWTLDVSLKVIAKGASPKLAPEATRQAAHQKLMADRTLGGLCIDVTQGPVSRSNDPDNPAAGIADCGYSILYRVQENTV